MFTQFLTKDKFYEKYMDLFATRFTMGSLRIEDRKTDLSSSTRAIEMFNNLTAFKNLVERNPIKITPMDVVDVAEEVNKNLNFFNRGFRKTQVHVNTAPFIPSPAIRVIPEMYCLFDNYYNVWNELPIYEREARFHIKFIRIHPFEDGNGRTGRIILNYNLCKENRAPVIISSSEIKKYFGFIDNNQVDQMTKFLEKKSKEELEVMLELYERICGGDFIAENGLTESLIARENVESTLDGDLEVQKKLSIYTNKKIK